MELIDNAVSPDERRGKYTNRRPLKSFLLLGDLQYFSAIKIYETQSFQIISRGTWIVDLNTLNSEIADSVLCSIYL